MTDSVPTSPSPPNSARHPRAMAKARRRRAERRAVRQEAGRRKTYDGLKIELLYSRGPDASPLPGCAPAAPWQVMARSTIPIRTAANTQALEDLENGANGLVLVCLGSIGAQGFGIDTSADGLARILDGIYLDAGAPIEFQLTREAKDVPAHVAALDQTTRSRSGRLRSAHRL